MDRNLEKKPRASQVKANKQDLKAPEAEAMIVVDIMLEVVNRFINYIPGEERQKENKNEEGDGGRWGVDKSRK